MVTRFDRTDREGQSVEFTVPSDAQPAADEARIAVIVAHGMGQQVPFETLGNFVKGVREEVAAPDTKVQASTRFVQVAGGKPTRLSRLETTLILNGALTRVDFYEVYWAPHTEGVATLRDVIRFLFSAGLGRWRPGKEFQRWVDGDFRSFDVPHRIQAYLWLALLVVGALVVLNTAIVAGLASKLALLSSDSWLTPGELTHLTRTFGVTISVLITFAALTMLSMRLRAAWIRRFVGGATIAVGGMAALSLIGAAVVAGLALTTWDVRLGAGLLDGLPPWPDVLDEGVWVVLALVSWWARLLIVQYIGDVAVYVEAQSLDRFGQARVAIREAAAGLARTIFDLGQYQHIAMAGHSLGSVVAYDTLNQLLLEDSRRRGRVRLLFTFGSPLDKTAYLFGSQVKDNSARELLAASLQPLIKSIQNRPRWVNVYSPVDIIGGKLDYYQDPDRPTDSPVSVQNHVDPQATTFLAAHVEHWKSPFLYQTFIGELEHELIRTIS